MQVTRQEDTNDARHVAFWTVREVADLLRVNRKAVYDAIMRGEVPSVRIGHAVRVPAGWINKLVDAHRSQQNTDPFVHPIASGRPPVTPPQGGGETANSIGRMPHE